jgi:DNA-binding NtrC family response regulator
VTTDASTRRVLVVDDDAFVVQSIVECLRSAGFDAAGATDSKRAMEMITASEQASGTAPFGVLLTDLVLPEMDGLALIGQLVQRGSAIVPLVMSGYATIERAVAAVRSGAMDVLVKPIADEELVIAIEKAMQQHALRSENAALRDEVDRMAGLDGIVGADGRMRRIFELVEAVAPTKSTVLMSGESGTGKSMIARAIHRRSPRGHAPFVELACGSIPETLLESELFGHVKGAFTGAHADKRGRFLAANGGTMFLDEINSASPGMQLKLLRVLQERKFEPVGSSETIEVDVRVILASNQKLEDLVASGLFRQDLYYRINVVAIDLPALRERAGDIPALAQNFLARQAEELGKNIEGFTPDALAALAHYDFPGNVRELQNIVERAAVLTKSSRIGLSDLPETVTQGPIRRRRDDAPSESWDGRSLDDALAEAERAILRMALEANGWNRQQTAESLRINRTTLYKKMRSLGLDAGDQR